jgi:hypothetical protein
MDIFVKGMLQLDFGTTLRITGGFQNILWSQRWVPQSWNKLPEEVHFTTL